MSWGRSVSSVTRRARVCVLLVLAAGFFTMHGFLAVSASAGTQAHAHAAQDIAVQQVAADLSHDVGQGPTGSPGDPEPTQHDVLMGCVVAVVGIAVLSLATLSLRHRAGWGSWINQLRAVPLKHLPSRHPSWSSPRIALCVIRV